MLKTVQEMQTRAQQMQTGAIDRDKRTVELSFSSEVAADRRSYIEVLSHKDGSIRMGRLNDGAPVLINHDPDRHVGVVERAWIEKGKGKAQIRLSKSADGERILNDIEDGILKNVSVGYMIHDVAKSRSGKDGVETVTATDWEPLEISLVSIPVDPGVGVGRAYEKQTEAQTQNTKSMSEENQNKPDQKTEPAQEVRSQNLDGYVKVEVVEGLKRSMDDIKKSFEAAQAEAKRQLQELKTRSEQSQPIGGIRSGEKGEPEYNLARAISGFIRSGRFDGYEAEVHQEMEKRGHRANNGGLLVPFSRNLTTATGSSPYGGYAQDVSVREPVDALRARTFFDRIGATVLTGLSSSVKIPRVATPGTVVVNTEGGSLSGTGDLVLGQESLDPLIVQGKSQYSKSLFATGVVSISDMIRNDMEKQIANKMEDLAIQGSGSSGQPQGLKTLSGATTTTASASNGTAYTYSDIIKMTQDTSAANAALESSRFLTSSKGFGKMRRTEISSNTAAFVGSISGGRYFLADHDVVVSNNVPSADTKGTGTALTHFYFGDWSYMVVGMFGEGIEVTVDPYTLADTNLVKLSGIALYDIGWTQPAAFARLLDAITA